MKSPVEELAFFLPQGVLLLDRDNRVVWANRLVSTQLEYEPSELVGLLIEEIIAPEDGVQLVGIDETFRGKKVQELNVLFLAKSGTPHRLLLLSDELPSGELAVMTRLPGATEKFLEESSRWAADERERADELALARDELTRANTEMQAMQQDLIKTSRLAGRAELAAGVLHNIGNVLNSVNVATSVLQERLQGSRVVQLEKIGTVLSTYLESPEKQSPEKSEKFETLLKLTATELARERDAMLRETQSLLGKIEHMRTIVDSQQEYARAGGVLELTNVDSVMHEAVDLHMAASTGLPDVELKFELEEIPDFRIDRHRVLQILINLVKNAVQATRAGDAEQKVVRLIAHMAGESNVAIAVNDNGVGIPEENLNKIFSHGFSSKKDGHGFGLHSSALAAKEMGGGLVVKSDGLGQGASFVLTIPFEQKAQVVSRHSRGLISVAQGG